MQGTGKIRLTGRKLKETALESLLSSAAYRGIVDGAEGGGVGGGFIEGVQDDQIRINHAVVQRNLHIALQLRLEKRMGHLGQEEERGEGWLGRQHTHAGAVEGRAGKDANAGNLAAVRHVELDSHAAASTDA